jgi:plastocyanin
LFYPMRKHFFSHLWGTARAACLAVTLLLLSACAPGPAPGGNIPTRAAAPTMSMPTQDSTSLPAGTLSSTAGMLSAIPVTGPRVTISNFTFIPDALSIPVGTTVTWANQDDTVHVVTSVDKLFASQALDTGDSFSFKFTTPGTYSYFCSLHPKMVGKIIVH